MRGEEGGGEGKKLAVMCIHYDGKILTFLLVHECIIDHTFLGSANIGANLDFPHQIHCANQVGLA